MNVSDECILDMFIIIDLPHIKAYLNEFIIKIKEVFTEVDDKRIESVISKYLLEE